MVKAGDGDGGDGTDPGDGGAGTPTVDELRTQLEKSDAERKAVLAERDELNKKLAEATKGRMTDAERIAALETDYGNLTKSHEVLNANFGTLKSTYEQEQAAKQVLSDKERTDIITKLKAARPGLDDSNLSKCDLLFLRDLAKNIVPPDQSARDAQMSAADTEREKRIAALREQRKAKSKR